jgi:dihydrofolate reductase
MARLIYSALCSLDGFIEDADGKFEYAFPAGEVGEVVNERERPTGTMLLGRRMYETLAVWETMDEEGEDYGPIWRNADKIVYSRTLTEAATARTRIETEFDPDHVRELKAGAERDLSIGGPELAGQAFRAGLVDGVDLYLFPVAVGKGKRALPDFRVDLELVEERRFDTGVVLLSFSAR